MSGATRWTLILFQKSTHPEKIHVQAIPATMMVTYRADSGGPPEVRKVRISNVDVIRFVPDSSRDLGYPSARDESPGRDGHEGHSSYVYHETVKASYVYHKTVKARHPGCRDGG